MLLTDDSEIPNDNVDENSNTMSIIYCVGLSILVKGKKTLIFTCDTL